MSLRDKQKIAELQRQIEDLKAALALRIEATTPPRPAAHVPESKNIYADYSFFKTTSIQLNDSRNINDISLIPSWVDNQELIYVDNPDNLEYDISVITHGRKL